MEELLAVMPNSIPTGIQKGTKYLSGLAIRYSTTRKRWVAYYGGHLKSFNKIVQSGEPVGIADTPLEALQILAREWNKRI